MPKKATEKAAKKTAKKGSVSASSLKGEEVEAQDLAAAGSEEAFEQHVEEAEALDERDIIVMRADVSVAHHNVLVAVPAVLSREETVKSELPKADFDLIRRLPSMALAVLFAARRVDRRAGASGETKALLARAWVIRELLITSAASLAAAGVIPLRAVQKIREGKGFFDLAKDCSDLAALFRKYAAQIKGKTPVTAAQIKEAGEVGAALLQALKPSSSKAGKRVSDEVSKAAKLRDRLWTLLVRGYRELRRIGMWLWVDEVDQHVPPLQSRAKASRKTGDSPSKPVDAAEPA